MTNLEIFEGNDKTYKLTIDKTETDFAVSSTSTTITLASNASSTTDAYKNLILTITEGTGSGQSSIISAYNGTTKVATVDAWSTLPDVTSKYSIAKVIVDITGYTVLFTVKNKINDTDVEALISKNIISHTDPTNGKTSIPVLRADTLNLKPKMYEYDIQLDTLIGDRITVLRGQFEVKQSVTDREI